MLRRLSTSLRLLGWSFLMAVAVWMAAVSSADPDQVRVYPAPVALQVVGQDPALVIRDAIPTQVTLTLRAPRSVWQTLESRPDMLRALLDLSELAAGTHQVPVQVQFSLRPVRVVQIEPALVSITLEPLASLSLPVELSISGEPATGFRADVPQVTPDQATVSGPASLVAQVARLRVSLDLAGLRESLDRSIAIEALNEHSQVIQGVVILPESAQVIVPVTQLGGYRDVAVKVVVRGQVADGYRLTDLTVSPPVVTVFSENPQNVAALPGYVETRPFDLNNARDEILIRLGFNLPPGVTVIGEQSVLVRAGVAPITGSLTLTGQPVEVSGLGAGLKATIAPSSVDVILSGPLPLLRQLTVQDVRVFVDLTGLSAGTYQLTPRAEVLIEDIHVDSLLPAPVEVVISAR